MTESSKKDMITLQISDVIFFFFVQSLFKVKLGRNRCRMLEWGWRERMKERETHGKR